MFDKWRIFLKVVMSLFKLNKFVIWYLFYLFAVFTLYTHTTISPNIRFFYPAKGTVEYFEFVKGKKKLYL